MSEPNVAPEFSKESLLASLQSAPNVAVGILQKVVVHPARQWNGQTIEASTAVKIYSPGAVEVIEVKLEDQAEIIACSKIEGHFVLIPVSARGATNGKVYLRSRGMPISLQFMCVD